MINGPLQFDCIANSLTQNVSPFEDKYITIPYLHWIVVCVLWLCVDSSPASAFKLDWKFPNLSWRSPGRNQSGPLALLLCSPSYHLAWSLLSIQLCEDSSHTSVIMSFRHCLGKAPGRNQSGPLALLCQTKGHHWESPKTPLPIKSTWATPNHGWQSAAKIHLGYSQSWSAISRKGFKRSWQPTLSKSTWFFQRGW